METTRLSSKGQVIIPKAIRLNQKWDIGQEFIVTNTENSIILKPKESFKPTNIDDVALCLKYSKSTKTLEDMENAIKEGALEYQNGGN